MKKLFLLSLLWVALVWGGTTATGQTTDSPWRISAGTNWLQYRSPDISTSNLAPGLSLGLHHYRRPLLNFRTQLLVAPQATEPLADSPTASPYVAFRYLLEIKLHNGIILREDAPISPYAIVGAGGSYHAGQPDAFSPFGIGLRYLAGPGSEIRVEAMQQVSWNRQPGTRHIAASYVHYLGMPAPKQPAGPEAPSNQYPPALAEQEIDSLVQQPAIAVEDEEEITLPQATTLTEPNAVTGESDPEPGPVSEPEPAASMAAITPVPDSTPEPDPQPAAPLLPPAPAQPLAVAPAPTPEAVPEATVLPEPAEAAPCTGVSLSDMAFSRGEFDVPIRYREVLNDLGAAMQQCPELRLSLTGYSRDGNGAEQNLVYAVKRAYNIKYYLVYEFGISQSRIRSKGERALPNGNQAGVVKAVWIGE